MFVLGGVDVFFNIRVVKRKFRKCLGGHAPRPQINLLLKRIEGERIRAGSNIQRLFIVLSKTKSPAKFLLNVLLKWMIVWGDFWKVPWKVWKSIRRLHQNWEVHPTCWAAKIDIGLALDLGHPWTFYIVMMTWYYNDTTTKQRFP